MMRSIKFSHDYVKMPPNPDPSRLVEVFVINRSLHQSFVAYDTAIVDGGNYALPDGKLLVLVLVSGDGVLWTTVRRWTPKKETYYREQRGKSMGVKIVCP